MDQDAHMRRIIDNLSSDLNNLSSETKRKFAPVKEASEACLLKLRQINSLKTNLYKSKQILFQLIQKFIKLTLLQI